MVVQVEEATEIRFDHFVPRAALRRKDKCLCPFRVSLTISVRLRRPPHATSIHTRAPSLSLGIANPPSISDPNLQVWTNHLHNTFCTFLGKTRLFIS